MIACSTAPGSRAQRAVDAPPATRPAAPLNIAITSPYAWPWVRRGSERMLHDLSRFLAGRGHGVTVFASGPEDRTEDRDGIPYHLLKQRFMSTRRQFNDCHYFAFRLQRALDGFAPDVVFSLNYFDAYAAIRARERSGARYKVVVQVAGTPTRRFFRAIPLDAWFFHTAIRKSSATLAVSLFARGFLEREFDCHPLVLPPPVMIEQFSDFAAAEAQATSPGPRILFMGDVDVPRKGARVLCQAFPRIKERHPAAQLLFVGHVSEATRRSLLGEPALAGIGEDVRFLGVGRIEELPAHYASASVTVLPAVWEAFGMVLVESLAAGTPVVGTRHGGIPDIIEGDLIGRLFDPGPFTEQTQNAPDLARALLEVLALGRTPAVVAACRARAERFSWASLGPEYERLLYSVAAA
jgi:phosphatidylinositol alpha-mannosyltransferase